MSSPARFLTFKCEKCTKPVKVVLQKVSACSHIQPYLGVCVCGEPVEGGFEECWNCGLPMPG